MRDQDLGFRIRRNSKRDTRTTRKDNEKKERVSGILWVVSYLPTYVFVRLYEPR